MEDQNKFIHTIPGTGIRQGISLTRRKFVRAPGTEGNGFVVTWVLYGKGSFIECGRNYQIRDGSVVLRRPDREFLMTIDQSESLRYYFDFPVSFYPAIAAMIPELDNLPPVTQRGDDKALREEFIKLSREFEKTSAQELYLLFPQIIHFLLGVTGILGSRARTPLELGRQLLSEATCELSLPEIAGKCGMTYDSFRKLFTATYGISPGKFRSDSRLEAAKDLLRLGEPIKSIAHRLGFSDVYSFNHWFTASAGITPGRYKEC